MVRVAVSLSLLLTVFGIRNLDTSAALEGASVTNGNVKLKILPRDKKDKFAAEKDKLVSAFKSRIGPSKERYGARVFQDVFKSLGYVYHAHDLIDSKEFGNIRKIEQIRKANYGDLIIANNEHCVILETGIEKLKDFNESHYKAICVDESTPAVVERSFTSQRVSRASTAFTNPKLVSRQPKRDPVPSVSASLNTFKGLKNLKKTPLATGSQVLAPKDDGLELRNTILGAAAAEVAKPRPDGETSHQFVKRVLDRAGMRLRPSDVQGISKRSSYNVNAVFEGDLAVLHHNFEGGAEAPQGDACIVLQNHQHFEKKQGMVGMSTVPVNQLDLLCANRKIGPYTVYGFDGKDKTMRLKFVSGSYKDANIMVIEGRQVDSNEHVPLDIELGDRF